MQRLFKFDIFYIPIQVRWKRSKLKIQLKIRCLQGVDRGVEAKGLVTDGNGLSFYHLRYRPRLRRPFAPPYNVHPLHSRSYCRDNVPTSWAQSSARLDDARGNRRPCRRNCTALWYETSTLRHSALPWYDHWAEMIDNITVLIQYQCVLDEISNYQDEKLILKIVLLLSIWVKKKTFTVLLRKKCFLLILCGSYVAWII